MHRIGIDLGGTKIEGVILGSDGRELTRLRRPTPRDYESTLGAIVEIIRELETGRSDLATVGVGIPGAIEPDTGLVKNANSTWLIDKPLRTDLSRLLDREDRVMNDANCFAISEATDGAGAGYSTVFGVILGTGCGAGIVIDRRLIDGPNLIAGEWGHNQLPWLDPSEYPGPPCYCGKNGCVESMISGPAFEADFARRTGRSLKATEIVTDSERDPAAKQCVERYHELVAKALSTVINILDPHVIVLGGGMSNLPGLAESVESRLHRYVFSNSVRTRVVRNAHGDSSGVRGAAWLWPA